ncbi:MAG: CotH kinase family protein, partial [Bacteroidota bacterium]
ARPTPDSSNGNSVCYSGYAPVPLFSLSPGYHTGIQQLEITTSTSGEVRYTTNGDEPGLQSAVYTSPLYIDRSQVIRARVFIPGSLPGPIVTNNYFIDEDVSLPVFTITTDSLNLWDELSGIYVLGPNASSTYPYQGANFWQDWRKPASISFYDRQRNKTMEFEAEISIYGNYSRAKPQKSFEINLADRFGTGEVNHQFFSGKPYLNETDNIVLRNSGTDWNKVHFRDAFMQRMMKNTYSGYLAAEPANLFLNGEYWGVYTIHENHDHHWMKYNFGLDEDQIDYLKEDGSTITVKAGSDIAWWDMYNYAVNEDPTTISYYNHLDQVLDLKNFADYFIVETYINNDDWIGDWTNNIKMWRPADQGGKFKYLLYDTDMGFGYSGLSPYQDRLAKALDPSAFSHSSELFDHITDNPTCRNYFINRYADLINTIYTPASLDAVMRSFRDSMAFDMPEHWQQWGGSLSAWNSYVSGMQSFYNNRPSAARNHIESAFQLIDQETITLQTSPAGAGRIQISTVIPDSYPWTGIYFQGNPVKLTAIPNPGFEFTHWSSTDLGPNDTNIVTQTDFTTNQTITAYFTGSARTPDVIVSEFNYNSSSVSDAGDWIELKNNSTFPVDLTDWKLYDESDFHEFTIPVGTMIPAGGYLVIAQDPDRFTTIYPSVSNLTGPLGFGFSNNLDRIRLVNHTGSVITSFYYFDNSPWPVEADGTGYTCERNFPVTDPNLPSSWFPGCLGGSPGGVYGSVSGLPVQIDGSSTFCAGAEAQLEATFRTGYSYQWYLDSVELIGQTGNSLLANQPGSYSVLASFQGCTSVSDLFELTQVLAGPEPVAISAYRCDPGVLTLVAQSTDTVYWFDAPGGQLISAGDTLFTPHLNTSTTYYAQTSLYCPSNAVVVNAQVFSQSTAPVAVDRILCGPGSIALSVYDTSSVTRWYNAPVAGALVATGDTFALAYLGNDTTFYIEAGSACPSERTVLNVQVVESSTPFAENVTRCGPGQVVLEAISPDPIRWLSSPSGGGLLSTNPIFTPTVNSSSVYYLQSVGTCFSNPVPVVVTILPVPSVPLISDTVICSPAPVNLVANSPEQVYWFSDTANITPFFTGPVYHATMIDSTVTFYIETGYVCRSSPRVPVTVEVKIPPVVDLGNDTAISSGDTLFLQAPSGFDFYFWSNGTQGAQLAVTQAGTYVVTAMTNDGCSVTDVIEVSVLTGQSHINGTEVLDIYPNPASDRSIISFFRLSTGTVFISLFDISGRMITEHPTRAVSGVNKTEIDVSSLVDGVYFVRIMESGRTLAMKRLVVNR